MFAYEAETKGSLRILACTFFCPSLSILLFKKCRFCKEKVKVNFMGDRMVHSRFIQPCDMPLCCSEQDRQERLSQVLSFYWRETDKK